MSTIALHVTFATVLDARHLTYARPSAAARTACQTAGSVGLVIMIAIVALLVTLARAAKGLAEIIKGLLHVAASITSVLFTMTIIVVVALAFVARH